jgi:hypothetical protein
MTGLNGPERQLARRNQCRKCRIRALSEFAGEPASNWIRSSRQPPGHARQPLLPLDSGLAEGLLWALAKNAPRMATAHLSNLRYT